MKKALVIYHKDDVDGIMSHFYMKLHLEENEGYDVDTYGMSYGDEEPSVDDYNMVAVVDFSLTPATMRRLYDNGSLLWFDHHQTAMDAAQAYGYDLAEGARSLDWSAVYLIYRNCIKEEVPHNIKLMDAYDTWKNDDASFFHDAKNYNAYLMSMQSEDELAWAAIGPIAPVITKGGAIIASERKKVMDCTKYSIDLMGVSFTAINYYSNEATELIDGPIAMFRCIGDNNVNVSLRGGDNLGDIARLYGGGGHKRAAGFNIPMLQWFEKLRG